MHFKEEVRFRSDEGLTLKASVCYLCMVVISRTPIHWIYRIFLSHFPTVAAHNLVY